MFLLITNLINFLGIGCRNQRRKSTSCILSLGQEGYRRQEAYGIHHQNLSIAGNYQDIDKRR